MWARTMRGAVAAGTATVIWTMVATGMSSAAEQDPAEVVGPQQVSSSAVLPDWAKTYEVSGVRELWLQPVYYVNDPRRPWDEQALLADVNETMQWYTVASRGALTVTATKVLEPVWVEEKGCNPLAGAWARRISDWRGSKPPEGVHLVGLSREATCPWGGLGAMPGNYLIVSYLGEAPRVRSGTLIHEFGHNLGLPHARSYGSGVLSTGRGPARWSDQLREYGDVMDPMGISHMYSVTPTWNPASMAALGWGDGVLQIPAEGTFTVDVEPVLAPGPDAVTFDDPVSGVRYLLTYNYTDDVLGRGNGVFLYESRYNAEAPKHYGGRTDTSFATFVPMYGKYSWMGAAVGTSWTAPSGGVAFQVNAADEGRATVTVTVDPTGGLSDVTGPSWMRGEPSVFWTGKYPVVEFGAAWDQSGVTVSVRAGGGKFRRVSNADPMSDQSVTVRLPRKFTGNTAQVTVRLTDKAGNRTDWTRQVSRR